MMASCQRPGRRGVPTHHRAHQLVPYEVLLSGSKKRPELPTHRSRRRTPLARRHHPFPTTRCMLHTPEISHTPVALGAPDEEGVCLRTISPCGEHITNTLSWTLLERVRAMALWGTQFGCQHHRGAATSGLMTPTAPN